MNEHPEQELERSFLPAYALARSVLYSDYGRKNSGYTKTQIAVLAALSWQNEMCMSQIAELVSVPRAQMTRVINPLVNDGLAERFTDNKNRRLVYIRLTGTGRDFIKEYLYTRFEMLLEKLSEEEAEKLTDAARTMVLILKKIRDER